MSTLGNDNDIDFNDSLGAVREAAHVNSWSDRASPQRWSVRVRSYRFDAAPRLALDGDSLTDTFTYTLIDSQLTRRQSASPCLDSVPLGVLLSRIQCCAVTASAADHTFTVRYTGATRRRCQSIDSSDLRVTGPGGLARGGIFWYFGTMRPTARHGSLRIASWPRVEVGIGARQRHLHDLDASRPSPCRRCCGRARRVVLGGDRCDSHADGLRHHVRDTRRECRVDAQCHQLLPT